MRTKNAKNKPKIFAVKLSEINKVFNPETTINISNEYKFLFENTTENLPKSLSSSPNKIVVKKIDFSPAAKI